MSDRADSAIGPVSPIAGSRPIQPVRAEPDPAPPRGADIGAITGGSLPAAYAQFVVDPDTHDVVIRVRDATTDQVISEYPSRAVEEMAAYMRQYAAALARRRATRQRVSKD